MKLLDVAEFYSAQGGGVRTYIHQKLAASAAFGHEMVVVAPGRESREENVAGGRIIWLKSPFERFDRRYHRFDNMSAIQSVLERERPDVVEASSPWLGARAVAQWSGNAVKSFIFHQDTVAVYPQTFLGNWLGHARVDWLFGLFWRYLRSLAGHFETTIVAGAWLEGRLRQFHIGHPHSVPFGIEKTLFSPTLRDPSVRTALLAQCGITNPHAKLLINVSRHHPEKRLSTVINAFARAASHQPLGLVIVGDGPWRQFVSRHAARVPGVFVAGRVDDRGQIARMLASADALVHGGAAETYGLVVAEALCSGLPMIVPDRGGAADLADPAYAETYKAGNVGDCAQAIKRLLAREAAPMRRAAAHAGRSRVATPEEHFQALFTHYAGLLATKAPILKLAS